MGVSGFIIVFEYLDSQDGGHIVLDQTNYGWHTLWHTWTYIRVGRVTPHLSLEMKTSHGELGLQVFVG